MASAIDSGVDTGNDSNDSSAQEKNFKMDCDNPRTQAPMLVINPTNQALEEKKDQSQPQSSNEMLTKDDSGPGMSLIHLQSSKPTWSIPVESEPKTILEYNTEDFCEIKRVFTVGGPFGIDYEDHPLMTKLRRGLPFRSRCIRNRAMDSYVRIRDITRICRAVCHNNTEAVKKLLEAGMSPNCHDSYKRTPLHIASCMGYTDMVKLLLDNGADPNAKDSIGNTPLHLAACTNHVSVITLLLKAGTRVSELDRAGHSPLRLAITKFNLMERSIMSHPVLKKQVFQVISMLTEYMNQKKGADHIDPDVLNKFEALVRISDSNEQVESNIRDLLNNLSSLSLSGPS